MPKPWNGFWDLLIELAALSFGWIFLTLGISGLFVLGQWAAPHLGWSGNPDMFGLLSVIAAVWIFESRRSTEPKHKRLGNTQ